MADEHDGVDEGGVRLAMLVVALALPGAFGDDAVRAVLRFSPNVIFGASLLVLAGFLAGDERIAVWVVALAIDELGPAVIGGGRGWRIAPEHFAERHGLIILIALGESIIAIGVGAGFELETGVNRRFQVRHPELAA